MQYLLNDIAKLPLQERLLLIEKLITMTLNKDEPAQQLTSIIQDFVSRQV